MNCPRQNFENACSSLLLGGSRVRQTVPAVSPISGRSSYLKEAIRIFCVTVMRNVRFAGQNKYTQKLDLIKNRGQAFSELRLVNVFDVLPN